MKIEVLGTSFDVESKPSVDKASVILVEGSVKVFADGLTKLIKPDEQFSIQRTTKVVSVSNVDAKLMTMWKDGVLVVQGQTIDELIENLSSWYGVRIINKSSVPKFERFNGRFDREDIETAVKTLCINANVRYRVESGNLIIEDL
jgi:ferric-dicitrate binding protein FerR (iron transport regulator)